MSKEEQLGAKKSLYPHMLGILRKGDMSLTLRDVIRRGHFTVLDFGGIRLKVGNQ
jgi:hypothetical protein